MKLTEWYSGDQNPVRVGVYERKYSDISSGFGQYFSYWDGESWGMGSMYRKDAMWYSKQYSQRGAPGLRWRGVAK